jgi:hypothetical protein
MRSRSPLGEAAQHHELARVPPDDVTRGGAFAAQRVDGRVHHAVDGRGFMDAVGGRRPHGLVEDLGLHHAELDDHHPDALVLELHAQRVGDGLQRGLAGGDRPGHRHGHAPGRRADVDDRAAGHPQARQERLCDRDLAEDVDLELAPQGVDRHELERSLDDDRGVVDQCPMEPYWSEKVQPPRRRS